MIQRRVLAGPPCSTRHSVKRVPRCCRCRRCQLHVWRSTTISRTSALLIIVLFTLISSVSTTTTSMEARTAAAFLTGLRQRTWCERLFRTAVRSQQFFDHFRIQQPQPQQQQQHQQQQQPPLQPLMAKRTSRSNPEWKVPCFSSTLLFSTLSSSSSPTPTTTTTTSTTTTTTTTTTASCAPRAEGTEQEPVHTANSLLLLLLLSPTIPCEILFDLQLPEGRCVGITLIESSRTKGNGQDDHTPSSDSSSSSSSSELTVDALSSPHHWIHGVLHPDEVAFALQKRPSDNGRESFLLGRLAMRCALGWGPRHYDDGAQLSLDASSSSSSSSSFSCSKEDLCICILKDEHGRPNVPPGYLGSISHKNKAAVALITKMDHPKDCSSLHGAGPTMGVGVDLEEVTASSKSSIARKVLTKQEIEQLGQVMVRSL